MSGAQRLRRNLAAAGAARDHARRAAEASKPLSLQRCTACTNERDESARVSDFMQVGFLWQWPVATILLAAMCQDGRVKHAIVSLAPGCCSLLSRTLNSWPCYSGFRRNSLAHASIAAVPPGRAPHFHLHLHRYAHRHPHRHSHPHSHLYSHPHPHLHFELKGRAHSALEGFVGARCSLQCWTTCKACTA